MKLIKIASLPLNKIKVNDHYGNRSLVLNGKFHWWHNGVDFYAPIGTPVYSVANGIVKVAKNNESGYGLYIAIDHGKFGTLYGHLSRFLVKPEDKVTAGQLIGYSGDTGAVTGPHLHFELRLGEYKYFWDRANCDSNVFMRAVDPMIFIEEYLQRQKDLTIEEATTLVQKAAGLEDKTMNYIVEDYKYGNDLIIKLAKAMK